MMPSCAPSQTSPAPQAVHGCHCTSLHRQLQRGFAPKDLDPLQQCNHPIPQLSASRCIQTSSTQMMSECTSSQRILASVMLHDCSNDKKIVKFATIMEHS